MKTKLICLLVVLMLAMVGSASAETVKINFNDLGASVYVGTHYPGLTFSGDALTIPTIFFPAPSPPIFVASETGSMRIDFDMPVSRVGFMYATFDSICYLEAYDSSDNLLDSVSAPGLGPYFWNPIEVSSSTPIAYVIYHDTEARIALDDLEYDTECNEIPEFPTIALPVAAILGLAFFFQRRKE
ncbi:PEF-CTERM sorting domain-containing protein [Methanolobus sp. ZRKC3]|uniref:PEF-CTERM sorting domain-containing protein n=1 Tax=Methanolobus sp. ZRKC3 TaxID=3125786 RepID=UPI00325229C7